MRKYRRVSHRMNRSEYRPERYRIITWPNHPAPGLLSPTLLVIRIRVRLFVMILDAKVLKLIEAGHSGMLVREQPWRNGEYMIYLQ